MDDRYIPTLDGWRAIAILLVLGDHLLAATVGGASGRTTLPGQLGVNLFFGLSGFLITSRLLAERRATGSLSLRRFYIRRAFRILPPALAYLAVLGAGAAIGVLPVRPIELVAAACFFRNYLPPNLPLGGGFFTWHFWSLAIEEHFYLCWPPIMRWLRPPAVLRAAAALSMAVAAWRITELLREGHRYGHTLVGFPWRTDLRLDALLAGAAVAAAYAYPGVRAWLASRAGAVAWVLAVASYGLVAAHWGVRPTIWQSALVPLMIAGTVARPRDPVGRLLDAAPVRWVGRLSYSLYLWQQLWLPPIGLPRTLGAAQAWPLDLGMLLACAVTSYYLVERPSIRLGRRLAGPQPVVGGSGMTWQLQTRLRSP